MSKTYYEILGIPRDANEQQIKLAYHRLAQKFHPDKAKDPNEAKEMQERFSEVSTAYNTLKDKEKRSAYDQTNDKARAAAADAVKSGAAPKTASSSGTGDAGSEKMKGTVAKRAFKKGLELLRAGDHTKAAEFFENAIKNEASEAIYHAKLAQSLLRGHRGFSRATEAAKRAIELDPYNSEYRLILAELYEAVGSLSMAIETYQDILKWEPTNERALQALEAIAPKKKGSFLDRLFGKK